MKIMESLLIISIIGIISPKTQRFMTIPFTIHDFSYKEDTNTLFNSFLYKDISVEIYLGNPKQKLPMQIGMGEYATFVVAEGAQGLEGGIYSKDFSSTFRTSQTIEELYHYQTFNEAFQSIESIHLQNPTFKIPNFEFLLVTRLGDNVCYLPYCEVLTEPGVLGLRMGKSESSNEKVNNTNFITQMKNKKIVDDFDFTFLFENSNSGHLIIGGKPENYDEDHYDENSYVYTRSKSMYANEKDWGLAFNQIMYGDIELANDKIMLMRIEYGVINGNKQWQNILEEEFFNKLIEEGKCFKEKGWNDGHNYYHYHCKKDTNLDDFKPFTLVINDLNYNLTLTKEDLFVEKDDMIYFLMTFGHPTLVLGLPVFKKYQFVFNQKTETIGLYTSFSEDRIVPVPEPINVTYGSQLTTYRAIIFILVVIIVFLVLIIVVYYLKKRSKRARKKSLSLLTGADRKEIQLSDFGHIGK